jgi:N-acetylglucosaminyldiphosphoundecaprenol N-acetyl-beta-D-mannosaminyltransferase
MTKTVFDLPFFDGSLSEAVEMIWKKVLDNEFVAVATPNPEQIIQMKDDANFAVVLKSFDVFLPDGQGIILTSKKAGHPLTARITGVDVVKALLEKMNSAELLGIVVGGKDYDTGIEKSEVEFKETPDFRSKAAKIYHDKESKRKDFDLAEQPTPRKITSHKQFTMVKPFSKLFWLSNFDKHAQSDTHAILEWIQTYHPPFVFVALGAPYQEIWISRHREILKQAGVRCVMTVGGAFDVLTGKVQRAPQWMQESGMEWLWRLIKEPWRWKRQLRLLRFVWRVYAMKQYN